MDFIKNYMDLLFYGILCFCIIKGFFTGFISELFNFLAIVVGIWCAYIFGESLALLFAAKIELPYFLAFIAAIIIIYAVVYLIISVVAFIIQTFIKIAMLSLINRFFGAIFGAIKAVIIIFAILYVLNNIPYSNKFLNASVFQKRYLAINPQTKLDMINKTKKTLSLLIEESEKLKNNNNDLINKSNPNKLKNFEIQKSMNMNNNLIGDTAIIYQNALKDTDLLDAIKNNDMPKILSNPKFQELLKYNK